MRRPAAELRRLAECVEIRSSTSVSVAGEVIEFGDTQAEEHAFDEFLSAALYRRFYCRPSRSTVPGPPDPRAVRVFVEALSSANAGSGCWDAGWIVESKEADGALQLRKPGQQLRFSASETDFRADGGEVVPGATGRLRIGKELREMLPGFYMVLGEADRPYRSPARPRAMTRFYWHLTAQAAAPWIAELTRRFNAATVPFEAKVLSDPATYCARMLASSMSTMRGARRRSRFFPIFTRRCLHVCEGRHRCSPDGSHAASRWQRTPAMVGALANIAASLSRRLCSRLIGTAPIPPARGSGRSCKASPETASIRRDHG